MNPRVFFSIVIATLVSIPLTRATGLHGPGRWLVGGLVGAGLAWAFVMAGNWIERRRTRR